MSNASPFLRGPTEHSRLLETQISPHDEVTDSQHHIFSRKWRLVVITALAVVQFTSFLDQTAIYTAVPAIAAGLQTGPSTSWIGTSFLITSTSIQLINGHLSDIFGRKTCLMSALSIMALGSVVSGFSYNPATLFASRAFSGFGAGALNALVQTAVSDLTTLKQRGYYFGIIGIATALGNGLGPLVGGLLAEKFGWRWTFWFIGPLAVIATLFLGLVFPPPKSNGISADNGAMLKKLRQVDWFGVITSTTAIILILIPLSQGGSVLQWDSPLIIPVAVAGVALFIIFIVAESSFVKFPILPFRLFHYGRSTNTLLAMNIIIGWVFTGNLFFIPLYFQNIRGWSPSTAGYLILPITIAHGVTSGVTGVLVAALGRYVPIISTGAVFWMIGAAAKTFYSTKTPNWMFLVFGIFEGVGIGSSLQPVLVGLLAGSQNADRAVITGLRNFIRDIGSALGITISSAILNDIIQRKLKVAFSPALIAQLTSSAFVMDDLDLSGEEKSMVLAAYSEGLRVVFLSYTVLLVVYFVCSVYVEDYGLAGKPSLENVAPHNPVEEVANP